MTRRSVDHGLHAMASRLATSTTTIATALLLNLEPEITRIGKEARTGVETRFFSPVTHAALISFYLFSPFSLCLEYFFPLLIEVFWTFWFDESQKGKGLPFHQLWLCLKYPSSAVYKAVARYFTKMSSGSRGVLYVLFMWKYSCVIKFVPCNYSVGVDWL